MVDNHYIQTQRILEERKKNERETEETERMRREQTARRVQFYEQQYRWNMEMRRK